MNSKTLHQFLVSLGLSEFREMGSLEASNWENFEEGIFDLIEGLSERNLIRLYKTFKNKFPKSFSVLQLCTNTLDARNRHRNLTGDLVEFYKHYNILDHLWRSTSTCLSEFFADFVFLIFGGSTTMDNFLNLSSDAIFAKVEEQFDLLSSDPIFSIKYHLHRSSSNFHYLDSANNLSDFFLRFQKILLLEMGQRNVENFSNKFPSPDEVVHPKEFVRVCSVCSIGVFGTEDFFRDFSGLCERCIRDARRLPPGSFGVFSAENNMIPRVGPEFLKLATLPERLVCSPLVAYMHMECLKFKVTAVRGNSIIIPFDVPHLAESLPWAPEACFRVLITNTDYLGQVHEIKIRKNVVLQCLAFFFPRMPNLPTFSWAC